MVIFLTGQLLVKGHVPPRGRDLSPLPLEMYADSFGRSRKVSHVVKFSNDTCSGPRPNKLSYDVGVPKPLVHFFQTFPVVLDAVVHPLKLLFQALLVQSNQTSLHDHRDATGLIGDLIPNFS